MARHTDGRTITFRTANPKLEVKALFGDGVPTLAGGVPNWSEVARPRKKSLINFGGFSPLTYSIPIVLDGFSEPNLFADNSLPNVQRSVEPQRAALFRMSQSVQNGFRPPVVQVIAGIPEADRVWVIANLTWGDALYTVGERLLVRIECTVDLINNIGTPELSKIASVLRGQNDVGTKGNLYTVKQGDTLRSIAAKELNDPESWRDLGLKNGIRDPRVKLTPGRKLKLL